MSHKSILLLTTYNLLHRRRLDYTRVYSPTSHSTNTLRHYALGFARGRGQHHVWQTMAYHGSRHRSSECCLWLAVSTATLHAAAFSQSLAHPPLSLSLSFVQRIVFRTGNSYDRWFEGAKDWQNSLSDCRSLARFMWTNIDLSVLDNLPKDDVKARASAGNVNADQHRERKKGAIRLLILFLYASKVSRPTGFRTFYRSCSHA